MSLLSRRRNPASLFKQNKSYTRKEIESGYGVDKNSINVTNYNSGGAGLAAWGADNSIVYYFEQHDGRWHFAKCKQWPKDGDSPFDKAERYIKIAMLCLVIIIIVNLSWLVTLVARILS